VRPTLSLLLFCSILGLALASPVVAAGGIPLDVIGWTYDSNGLIVEVDLDPGESGIIVLSLCLTLEDGTQTTASINASTNGHEQGRGGSTTSDPDGGTVVIAESEDIDTSIIEVDAAGDPIKVVDVCAVEATLTATK
jgi:hypothetical protein